MSKTVFLQWAIALFFISGARAASGTCTNGVKEGEIVNRGRYWYQCENGQLQQKGCLDQNDKRIPLDGTYDSNGYRMQCVKDRDGYLAFSMKSCLYQGREHEPNDEWDDVKYYYKCVKEGDHLRVEVAGCLDQGRRVHINEKVVKGGFVHQCLKTKNGTCSMCPVACTKDNREYTLGEAFEKDDYWYMCQKDPTNPRRMTIKPSGCVNGGKRYYDQGRFNKDDTVYECYARDGQAKIVAVGCVTTDNGATTERRFDDTWNEGRAPFRYEMTCQESDRHTAIKVQKRCTYEVTNGQYNVEAGCYKIVDKSAIGCLKDGSNGLQIRAFRMDDIQQVTAMGLRLC